MRQYTQLVKRNLLIYLRDKGAIFFSLLSMLVVLCLMVFFLGDVNITALTDELALLPNRDETADRQNAYLLILAWTAGGIIPVNAVTVTLSSFSVMIKDKTCKRFDSIYTSPVSRGTVVLSYITAACFSSIIICALTFAISEIFCVVSGAAVLSLILHIEIFIMIIVNSFVYSAIMYLFAAFIKSEGAWSGFGTVIGVLVGFFGGIYMPIGELSSTLAAVLKCTPVIYSTVMFRQIICKDALDTLFYNVPVEITDIYKETMGITISLFDKNISSAVCMAILAAFGIAFIIAGILITKHLRKMGNK